MIRRKKTTIFTDAKDNTTVSELKKMIEGEQSKGEYFDCILGCIWLKMRPGDSPGVLVVSWLGDKLMPTVIGWVSWVLSLEFTMTVKLKSRGQSSPARIISSRFFVVPLTNTHQSYLQSHSIQLWPDVCRYIIRILRELILTITFFGLFFLRQNAAYAASYLFAANSQRNCRISHELCLFLRVVGQGVIKFGLILLVQFYKCLFCKDLKTQALPQRQKLRNLYSKNVYTEKNIL